MQPLLVFPATDLDTAGRAFDVALTHEWIAAELADVEATAVEPGRATGRLSLSGTSDIVVRGDARVSITVPCARCLDPARIDLTGEVSLLLRPGKVAEDPIAPREATAAERSSGKRRPRAEPEALRGGSKKPDPGAPRGKARPKQGEEDEYEFSSEEADHDVYDGETVVLDPFVREALLLEIPNFPLCSDDCAGIRTAPEGPIAREEEAPAPPPGVKSLGDALRAAMARPSEGATGAKTPSKKKRTR
jgi:uncharacterized protein